MSHMKEIISLIEAIKTIARDLRNNALPDRVNHELGMIMRYCNMLRRKVKFCFLCEEASSKPPKEVKKVKAYLYFKSDGTLISTFWISNHEQITELMRMGLISRKLAKKLKQIVR